MPGSCGQICKHVRVACNDDGGGPCRCVGAQSRRRGSRGCPFSVAFGYLACISLVAPVAPLSVERGCRLVALHSWRFSISPPSTAQSNPWPSPGECSVLVFGPKCRSQVASRESTMCRGGSRCRRGLVGEARMHRTPCLCASWVEVLVSQSSVSMRGHSPSTALASSRSWVGSAQALSCSVSILRLWPTIDPVAGRAPACHGREKRPEMLPSTSPYCGAAWGRPPNEINKSTARLRTKTYPKKKSALRVALRIHAVRMTHHRIRHDVGEDAPLAQAGRLKELARRSPAVEATLLRAPESSRHLFLVCCRPDWGAAEVLRRRPLPPPTAAKASATAWPRLAVGSGGGLIADRVCG